MLPLVAVEGIHSIFEIVLKGYMGKFIISDVLRGFEIIVFAQDTCNGEAINQPRVVRGYSLGQSLTIT